MHLDVADTKARVVANRQLNHLKALVIIQEVVLFFQGVLRGNNKPQRIQVGELDQIVGQHHVAVMDGVERA